MANMFRVGGKKDTEVVKLSFTKNNDNFAFCTRVNVNSEGYRCLGIEVNVYNSGTTIYFIDKQNQKEMKMMGGTSNTGSFKKIVSATNEYVDFSTELNGHDGWWNLLNIYGIR